MGKMPKSPYLKDLFIKHFVAKSFGWTPRDLSNVTADELDHIMYIESEINQKEKDKIEEMKFDTEKEQVYAGSGVPMGALINKAKKSQLIGTARGSAGGSLVAYLTGITQVDPIKYDLQFSRFLRKDAKDYPDIDVDFSYNMQLKEELIRDWGQDRVVPITNFSTSKLSIISTFSIIFSDF